MRNALVSGAGIAGATTAYWLARRGFEVTVVERAAGARSSGSPVDVRGPAVEVAERMGVMGALRDCATGVRDMVLVNGRGRVVGRVDMTAAWAERADVELPRADLARVLREAAAADTTIRFGDWVTALDDEGDGVVASLHGGDQQRFDLVVGADGVHSAVRALAFGPEADYVRHLGIYVATMPLDGETGEDLIMYNTPGRAVAIHPAGGRAIAAFMFRAPAVAHFDHRDLQQHKRLLLGAYAGAGWRVPELLDRVRLAEDLYFDSVSKVQVPRWSRSRIGLVGDAASCVSLFGDGSSLAMVGGYTLADAVGGDVGGDIASGLRAYEARHRPQRDAKENTVGLAAALLVPATRTGILIRDVTSRLWPVAGAAARWGREFTSGSDRVIVDVRRRRPQVRHPGHHIDAGSVLGHSPGDW